MNRKSLTMRPWVAITICSAALLAGGCSSFFGGGPSSGASPEAAPAAQSTAETPKAAAPAQATELPAAPVVNVFGEFGGPSQRQPGSGREAGFQQHTASDEGYDADVAIDPTGKWLAFASTRHSEHADIYLQRAEGTSVIQLTNDAAEDAQPAFSPDGKRIAFCSTRSGNWDIYVMDVDGKNVEQITNSPAQEMHPSFSPDGNKLVYCALSPRSDQWELWTTDLTTHERRTIGQGLFPTWCPRKDVDRIAFQRARQRGSRWFSLWTVDLVNGEPRRLTEVAVSSNAALISPSWSPDGARIAFTAIIQPTRPTADKAEGSQDVWVVAADGSSRQRLTEGRGLNLSPFWAADNRVYFISDHSGHENIWSVHVDGTKTATAANGEGGERKEQASNKTNTPAGKSEKAASAAVGPTETNEVGK